MEDSGPGIGSPARNDSGRLPRYLLYGLLVANHEFSSLLAQVLPQRFGVRASALCRSARVGAGDGDSSAKRELRSQEALAIWCSRTSDTHNKPVTWEYAFRSSRPYDIYAGRSHRGSSRVQVAEP